MPIDLSPFCCIIRLVRLVRRFTTRTEWKLQDAKARFSELFERALTDGAQVVSRRGKQKVVVIAKEEYDRLVSPHKSLSAFLLDSPLPGSDLNLERLKDLPRSTDIEA